MNIEPRNNFDLLKNFIPYKIVKYKDLKYYAMINVFVNDANIFGYTLYFFIDEKFSHDYEGNEIYEFLSNIDLQVDDIYEVLHNGNEVLIPGKDYFVTGAIEDADKIMSANINDYIDLSCVKIKDIDHINYFIYKNTSKENQYSSNDLYLLNVSFMSIIRDYSEKYNDIWDTIDLVYKNVIDYYANSQFDDAIILMNTIFNTQLNVTTTTNCGCNSKSDCVSTSSTSSTINTGTDLVSLDTATCIDKYKAAMYQWLMQMLSDTSFYCNWMFTILTDDNTNMTAPDEELLDRLIDLLTEFLNAGYDLSNLKGCKSTCGCSHTKKYSNNMTGDCVDLLSNGTGVNTDNCSYYSIIENYIKVLNWVKNNQIDENKNKIYIYGKQFAEIFPLLNFN